MTGVRERARRELDVISAPEKIRHLVSNYLINRSMFLRGTDPPRAVTVSAIEDSGNIVVYAQNVLFQKDEIMTLFRIMGRYIQFQCRVVAVREVGYYELAVLEASIARSDRKVQRIPVAQDEMHINNIRTSKTAIEIGPHSIPVSIKVNFATLENKLKEKYDFIKIDAYGKRGSILDVIKKTGKTLLVMDTQDPQSYRPLMPEFVDYAEYLGDDLHRKILDFKQLKIVSEMIVPINYYSHDESAVPLGYMHVQSREKRLDMDSVLELQAFSFEMVDRIRDSNTVLIQTRQRVLDVSRTGLKILIDHGELCDYLIRQNGFTFDLFFKGQAPITIYGLIRSTHQARNGNLTLGVQILGNSAREGEMRRFMDNVLLMERRYKDWMKKEHEGS